MKKRILSKAIVLSLVLVFGISALFLTTLNYSNSTSVQADTEGAGAEPSIAERIWAISNKFNLDTDIKRDINSTTWADLELDKISEFEIDTVEGLENLSYFVSLGVSFTDKTIFLSSDIDYAEGLPFTEKPHISIGTSASPFTGTFDGRGFEVQIIRFSTAENEPAIGFFGNIKNAIIKDLVIANYGSEPVTNVFGINRNHFGAIVGTATDSIIANCVNKADITNNTTDGNAAGIVAYTATSLGKTSQVVNCVNYGNISAPNSGTAASITCTTDTNTKVQLCANFGDVSETITHDILDWAPGTEWDTPANRTDLIITFNDKIHAAKYDPLNTYDGYPLLCLWGFTDSSMDFIGASYLIDSLNYGVVPVLTENILHEQVIKNMSTRMIMYFYLDAYSYIDTDDENSKPFVDDMYKNYVLCISKLEEKNMYQLVGEQNVIIELMDMMSTFVDQACTLINGGYEDWFEYVDTQYVKELFTLAKEVTDAWYYDSRGFIVGDDERSVNARKEIDEKYEELLDELRTTTPENNVELIETIKRFTTNAIDELDNIYFTWEIGGYIIDMDEAYEEIIDSTSKGRHAEINKIYNDTRATIDEAEFNFENTQDERGGAWIDYSTAVEEAVYGMIAEFETLQRKWQNEQVTIIWTSALGAFVLVAAIAIISLVIVIRIREKKYKAILFNVNTHGKKTQQIEQKADEISRELESRREIADEVAKVNRQKAELLLQLEREKKEQQELIDRVRERTERAKSNIPNKNIDSDAE